MNSTPDYIKRIEEKNLLKYLPDVNMSDRDKEIVNLYVNEGKTYQEIGEKYGISGERARQLVVKFSKKAMHFYYKENKDERI